MNLTIVLESEHHNVEQSVRAQIRESESPISTCVLYYFHKKKARMRTKKVTLQGKCDVLIIFKIQE